MQTLATQGLESQQKKLVKSSRSKSKEPFHSRKPSESNKKKLLLHSAVNGSQATGA